MVYYSKAYWKRVSDRNRVRGKRAQAVLRESRLTQEIDADTLRQRDIYDRRGTTAFIIKRADASFLIQHSVCGRSDQYDIFYRGKIISTCRLGLVLETLANIPDERISERALQ